VGIAVTMNTEPKSGGKRDLDWRVIGAVLGLFLVAVTPIIFNKFFDTSRMGNPDIWKVLLIAVPVAAVTFCYRKLPCSSNRDRIAIILLISFIASILVDIHFVYIDNYDKYASHYFANFSNPEWQIRLHQSILNLDPGALPHSYRFLPDSIVSLFEFLSDDFSYSRFLYRWSSMFVLIFAIYYYSFVVCNRCVAMLTILFYGLIYQISIRYYAGQLTDPLSHLSFVLSFIFIELDMFIYFVFAIVIGVLAKESVAIMAVYYLIFQRRDLNYALRAFLVTVLAFGTVIAVRIYVNPGFKYASISGAGSMDFIIANLSYYNLWLRQLAFTVGIFIPFVILGWKTAPQSPKRLTLLLFPVLLGTNVVFSMIHETRNLVPVAIPMALIAANYLYQVSDIHDV
jgi:hypothetical protein